jgi:organic radical activating enzyme
MIKYSSEELEQLFISANSSNNFSRESLEAVIKLPPIILMADMGPYCPNNCSHCYGNYGILHDKSHYMHSDIIQEVFKDINQTNILRLTLSDGEPFYDINNLEEIVHTCREIPTSIFTSGFFANDLACANDYISRIRKQGFSFNNTNFKKSNQNNIAVSLDEFHNNSFQTTLNMLDTIFDVYSDELIKNKNCKLEEGNIIIFHTTKDQQFHKKWKKDPYETLKKDSVLYPFIQEIKKKYNIEENASFDLDNPTVKIYTNKASFEIQIDTLTPLGRAKNVSKKEFPNKKINKVSIPSKPKLQPCISVDYLGNIYSDSPYCRASSKKYGNILKEPLPEIINKMNNSSIYKLDKISDLGGLIHILNIIDPKIKMKTDYGCNLCKELYSDEKLINYIEQILKKQEEKGNDVIKIVYGL